MSSQVVLDAVTQTLTTQFPAIAQVDVSNETPEYPTDDYGRPVPFFALFGLATEEQSGIGAPDHACYRETGTVNIALYYPSGLGSRAPRELADQVRGTFRGRALPTTTQRHVHIRKADPMTNLASTQDTAIGSYYVAGVSLAYHFDYIG